MKTFNNLYSKICSFDNLVKATTKSKKNKKKSNSLLKFHFNLEENLLDLNYTLSNKTYQPGKYKTFTIYDPKTRMISAAPYKDRVVHHALCNIIEPIFDKTFISDSYANRKSKGTHKALIKYQEYAKKYKYVLKCDIKKFFPSIDHEILKKEIRWKIKCTDTLWLIDLIIDNSNKQEKHLVWFDGDDLLTPSLRKQGLPIGNLTSQIWGNVYMNRFDHYIKETLKVKGYIRYVDDFVLFSNNKKELAQHKMDVIAYLTKIRLIVHPNKTQIFQVCKGVPFLGFINFPTYRYVQKPKIKRYFRHINKILKNRKYNDLSPEKLESMFNAWLGHIRFGEHRYIENQLFNYICKRRVNLFKHPSGSWRVLEQ